MDGLIDCKNQSHHTNSFTEHHILVQCKTKRTENFFKCGEGYTLNNRRLSTGDELQSFDVFGKHLSVFKIFVYLCFVGICYCVHTNPEKKYDQYFLSTFYIRITGGSNQRQYNWYSLRNTGWLSIRIMCQSGVICLSVGCYFSVLVL